MPFLTKQNDLMYLTGDGNTSMSYDDQLIGSHDGSADSAQREMKTLGSKHPRRLLLLSDYSQEEGSLYCHLLIKPLFVQLMKTCLTSRFFHVFFLPFMQILRFLASNITDHQMTTELLIGFVWREKLAHTKNWHRKLNQCSETLGYCDSCT